MKRGTIIAGLLVTAHAGCVDTHLPDLTAQLGVGRTAAGPCTNDDLGELPPETLQMHVIDVGQGDAIWIRTPYYTDPDLESRDILIDTGPADESWFESPSGVRTPGGDIVVDYMTRFGRLYGDPLDAVVITHDHADHYGGLKQVAEAFFVERYYGPTYVSSDHLGEARTSARDIMESKVPNSAFIPEDGFALADELLSETDLFGGYVDAHLLWAAHAPPPGSDENDTSIVLSLSWSDRRILLMGDAEEHVEEQLIEAHDDPNNGFNLAAHVLKVGHHGSSTSSTEGFLQRVLGEPDERDEPIWAIISSGRKSFGGTQLPSAGTVDRLREHLQPYHLLSTENDDEERGEGEEYNDDHVLVTIGPNGEVRACYVP
jgi:beta-lactamase superfamily II metal-dependent hydrolase